MLFRSEVLHKIKEGEVTHTYRKWKRRMVKPGGTQLTQIGQLLITSVEKISYDEITDSDIAVSGFNNREDLQLYLSKKEGEIYKIGLQFEGKDPRIELRATLVTDDEFDKLQKQLAGYDKRSKHGNWTIESLEIIERRPSTLAKTLATELGFERDWWKLQVRKLKKLGLTESLKVGYQLSPRGKDVLERLRQI